MNKQLFKPAITKPTADNFGTRLTAINDAGGAAYAMSHKHALAQYALTGMLHNTYYANAAQQLNTLKQLLEKVPLEYAAKLAVYAYKNGFMKDVPVYMLAWISTRDSQMAKRIFPYIVDNGKQLRNFVSVIRSKSAGRYSFGSAMKKQINAWLTNATEHQLLAASIGNDPSLADVIKLTHPKPKEKWREAFFSWCIGGKEGVDYKLADLPPNLRHYLEFKRGDGTGEMPKVPFQMLTSLELTSQGWNELIKSLSYQQTRMNLNMLERNGVFSDYKNVRFIADRIGDKSLAKRSRLMPYQAYQAWKNTTKNGLPAQITTELEKSLIWSLESVPEIDGKTLVLVDVSGSMNSLVGGSKSSTTCAEVAGLFASALLFKNGKHNCDVKLFDTSLRRETISEGASVAENTQLIGRLRGGGTAIGYSFEQATRNAKDYKNIIVVSDNESWSDYRGVLGQNFKEYTKVVRDAKLVCIDIVPNRTTQAVEGDNVLNIGGFNDNVFKVISDWLNGSEKNLVADIESFNL